MQKTTTDNSKLSPATDYVVQKYSVKMCAVVDMKHLVNLIKLS